MIKCALTRCISKHVFQLWVHLWAFFPWSASASRLYEGWKCLGEFVSACFSIGCRSSSWLFGLWCVVRNEKRWITTVTLHCFWIAHPFLSLCKSCSIIVKVSSVQSGVSPIVKCTEHGKSLYVYDHMELLLFCFGFKKTRAMCSKQVFDHLAMF